MRIIVLIHTKTGSITAQQASFILLIKNGGIKCIKLGRSGKQLSFVKDIYIKLKWFL